MNHIDYDASPPPAPGDGKRARPGLASMGLASMGLALIGAFMAAMLGPLLVSAPSLAQGTLTEAIITTVAGSGMPNEFGFIEGGFVGDGGPAFNARLDFPTDLVVKPDGSLIIADSNNQRIRLVNPDGVISTVAGIGEASPSGFIEGGFSGDGGPVSEARFNSPTRIAIGPDAVFITDQLNQRIRRVNFQGIITTAAGNGEEGFSGDGGPADNARLGFEVGGVAALPDGSFLIADGFNQRIRKIDPSGTITTLVGSGVPDKRGRIDGGFSGDGGPASEAQFRFPSAIALATDGSLYITDQDNQRIRKVDPQGIITTVAGSGDADEFGFIMGDYSGDGGPATSARLNFPSGVALGPDGSLYIADSASHRIRKVTFGGTNNGPVDNQHIAIAPSVVSSSEPFTLRLTAQVPGGLSSVTRDTLLVNGLDTGIPLLPLLIAASDASASESFSGFVFTAESDGVYTWIVESPRGTSLASLCVNIGGGVSCP